MYVSFFVVTAQIDKNKDYTPNSDLESLFGDISDLDDPTYKTNCEVKGCNDEVFSSCHICLILLCWEHFQMVSDSCDSHTNAKVGNTKTKSKEKNTCDTIKISPTRPESFLVEGEEKEEGICEIQKKGNKQKLAKKMRDLGKDYVRPKTGVAVPARQIKRRCNIEICQKSSRDCHLFSDEDRTKIFDSFYQIGNLTRQRDFIVRHVISKETTYKTSKKEHSRRQRTNQYFLSLKNSRHLVCKTFFVNTLSISERFMRTALEKVNENGLLEEEKRGGRQSAYIINRDQNLRNAILNHIKRFPKVESHYCRSSSTKEYLHPGLTVSKMYDMFLDELDANAEKPCIDLYRKVFRSLNLAFHKAKKDQCSLCLSYRTGDNVRKEQLKARFEKHVAEKMKVREIKQNIKTEALHNSQILCASFDLQQVIYLPQSKESAIFYKNRLANYNFTVYNIASKECFCYLWNEVQSKRGASEISSCIYKALSAYDTKNIVKSVALFSDGCSGQNKNSITAAMLLYTVANSRHIEKISIRFFESFHGQNEGDSAHSAISTALTTAGDIFVPSQLYPIVRLARRKLPYIVEPLEYQDFSDFKKLSTDLRILSIRTSDSGHPVKWANIMELMVKKSEPSKIYFKNSHLQQEFDSLTILQRQKVGLSEVSLERLNLEVQKLSSNKYKDLKSLCEGPLPVVRVREFQHFYLNLQHDLQH